MHGLGLQIAKQNTPAENLHAKTALTSSNASNQRPTHKERKTQKTHTNNRRN
jgi:hypothetical protein